MKQQKIDECVEDLCNKGCKAVWGVIDSLESGMKLPETAHLKPAEIDAVVDELKTIMAVYDGTCSAS